MKKHLFTAMALASSVLMSSTAQAEVNANELASMGKILLLSKDIAAGSVEMAVVYNPADAGSKADLDSIKSIIGGGYSAPKHTITIKEVTEDQAASANNPLVFVTSGVSAGAQAALKDNATSNKSLIVTSDMGCVEAGNCTLGIDVGSSVNITLNGSLYRDSGLSFDSAFEFMVKEI